MLIEKKYLPQIAVIIICSLSIGYVFGLNNSVPVSNQQNQPETELSAYYLYPQRCMDCASGSGTDCEMCNTYYSFEIMPSLEETFNIPFKWYASNLVGKGSLLVIAEKNIGLGVVEGKFSIANTICKVTKNANACQLVSEELERSNKCLGKYNISRGDIIYYYTSGECSYCDETSLTVNQIKRDTDVNIVKIDYLKTNEKKIIDECLSAFSTKSYLPEIICPSNGLSLVGSVSSFSKLEDFALSCKK